MPNDEGEGRRSAGFLEERDECLAEINAFRVRKWVKLCAVHLLHNVKIGNYHKTGNYRKIGKQC